VLANIADDRVAHFTMQHIAASRDIRGVERLLVSLSVIQSPEAACAQIGDRAYDSDPLDEELRNDGIEMIAPHRSNRSKPPTQDRRRLSRYTRRWLVERFFAWIQWQRRVLVRWEYHAQNFLGFVQLACLVACQSLLRHPADELSLLSGVGAWPPPDGV
jgi:transposase